LARSIVWRRTTGPPGRALLEINVWCVPAAEECRRRWRPGRVPIIAALITAIGAMSAAAVAGAFNAFG
jgi:hypothetical protein